MLKLLFIQKTSVAQGLRQLSRFSTYWNHTRKFVYCCGNLLRTIQLADLFSDSKSFIDKKLKYPVHDVLMNYEIMVNSFGRHQPTVEALRQFVADHFEDAKELESWTPPDWKESPHILNRISDKELRTWAVEMNRKWRVLGRKTAGHVKEHPQLYSTILLPHGFLVSGEGAKELYYWESYWILNGILKCNMWDTAKDMIKNFLYLVEKYSYVPSGTRIYFKQRSQPPLLTMMMESYYNHTKDLDFLKQNIEILEREMEFWRENRTVVVRKSGYEYQMFQYKVTSLGPRPEQYREDIKSGLMAESDEELEEHFSALKSASESGWNLSSRWFVFRESNHGDRSNIHTEAIVPVDLNALIQRNFVLFSKWYQLLGDKVRAKKYEWEAENLLKSIEIVFWNKDTGIWLDYDLSNSDNRNYFYLSNFVPLWTKSYRQSTTFLTENVINYLTKHKANSFAGGVPSSLEDSGELWDFPNCSPPLQAYLIQGLDRLGTPHASRLALHLAQKFINNSYEEFKLFGETQPFYNCLGGGYKNAETVHGFGWTNGLIFELLDRWGDQLILPSSPSISQTRLESHRYLY